MPNLQTLSGFFSLIVVLTVPVRIGNLFQSNLYILILFHIKITLLWIFRSFSDNLTNINYWLRFHLGVSVLIVVIIELIVLFILHIGFFFGNYQFPIIVTIVNVVILFSIWRILRFKGIGNAQNLEDLDLYPGSENELTYNP